MTRELTRLNLQISSAKISTYGEKVVDVFYVKNLFGHKVEQPAKLAEIRSALEAVLAKGNEAATAGDPPRARRRGIAMPTPAISLPDRKCRETNCIAATLCAKKYVVCQ